MFKMNEEVADIKNADKKYPYKVNFGRFLKRKMKGTHTSSGNEIVTSHYTKANWFPMALFAQLKKPVIIYFFIITIITCLPFSGQDPSFLIVTLVVVILFSMVRELFEDLKR
jgi:phospholipid-transporting ATPase